MYLMISWRQVLQFEGRNFPDAAWGNCALVSPPFLSVGHCHFCGFRDLMVHPRAKVTNTNENLLIAYLLEGTFGALAALKLCQKRRCTMTIISNRHSSSTPFWKENYKLQQKWEPTFELLYILSLFSFFKNMQYPKFVVQLFLTKPDNYPAYMHWIMFNPKGYWRVTLGIVIWADDIVIWTLILPDSN